MHLQSTSEMAHAALFAAFVGTLICACQGATSAADKTTATMTTNEADVVWSRFYVNLRANVPGVSVMDHTSGSPVLRWGLVASPACMPRADIVHLKTAAWL
jgi:hypothetical protein